MMDIEEEGENSDKIKGVFNYNNISNNHFFVDKYLFLTHHNNVW
jgi:hypothetical protein